ncbi:MAG TPA: hypothetical protein VFT90_02955, partial [Chryseosolibacter sp.]|nr:hypothetical protein [Chryseosolibacter sp.]
ALQPSIDQQINLTTVDQEQAEEAKGFFERVFGGKDDNKKDQEQLRKEEKKEEKKEERAEKKEKKDKREKERG